MTFWILLVILLIVVGRIIINKERNKQMASIDRDALQADLQALADKHQAHLLVTATPVSVEDLKFDVTASPTV
jgi:hypothetical protein